MSKTLIERLVEKRNKLRLDWDVPIEDEARWWAETLAEELEQQDFAPDSPRGNAICRMVDAAEVAYLTTYLASDKAWAITGEVIAAGGGTGSAVYY